MKNFLTSILLLIILAGFSIFIIESSKTKEVLTVYTPTKFGIDLNKDKIITSNEIFCADEIESFSLEPTKAFYDKYAKTFNLSKVDMIKLGYLAQEFAVSTLQNQRVMINETQRVTNECRYANIKTNRVKYSEILKNSGFGIFNEAIGNTEKFNEKLKQARKLNLVILNHHSNKYHTLDCKYAKLAHDTVIIPQKQLPKNAIPCKFCHEEQNKKAFNLKKDTTIINIPKVKEPPLITTNGEISIMFSDFTKKLKPDSQCLTNECREFLNLTNSTKESIDIAIYGYDDIPKITEALKQAKARGIKIRFVYDEHSNPQKTYYKSNNIIKELADEHRSDKSSSITQTNMLMHNKFVIFDRNTVFTGSMNFSRTGLSGYDANNVIIINSKEIAEYYEKEFEQMISGKFHNQKNKFSTTNIFQLKNSNIEIYFSPQDQSSKRIIELIKNAKHYIYIPTFLITHSQISNELITAHKRGVDIKIIMDANNVHTTHTKHAILRANGIPLKIENYAGKMHSKAMIIDDEYIITGSMNFSNSGENKNDENMLIIKNSEFAKSYKKFFLYLWAIIPDKYLKFNPKAEGPDSIGSCSDGVDNNFNGKIDNEDDACKINN